MFLASPEMAKRIARQRIANNLKETETRRLLREAGMDPRSRLSGQTFGAVRGAICNRPDGTSA